MQPNQDTANLTQDQGPSSLHLEIKKEQEPTCSAIHKVSQGGQGESNSSAPSAGHHNESVNQAQSPGDVMPLTNGDCQLKGDNGSLKHSASEGESSKKRIDNMIFKKSGENASEQVQNESKQENNKQRSFNLTTKQVEYTVQAQNESLAYSGEECSLEPVQNNEVEMNARNFNYNQVQSSANECELIAQSADSTVEHQDSNGIHRVTIREISDHSNLSSPQQEILQDFEQVKSQEMIGRQEYDFDFNHLDESLHQPLKTNQLEKQQVYPSSKFDENSFEEFLKKTHKINLEQLIKKSVNFHQYIISVITKQQKYDLHELLQNYSSTQQIEEYSKIEKIQELIQEALKKENYNDQDEFAQNSAMQNDDLAFGLKYKDHNLEPHQYLDHNLTFDFTPHEKFRAKLYQLDGNQRWQDKGTGYFSIKNEGEGKYSMQLIEETENKPDGGNQYIDLLNNEVIEQQLCFKRQRDTIITWQDKDRDRDQAVSFQNCQGALYTWEKICIIQNIDPDKNSQESIIQEEDPFSNISFESIHKMAEELKMVSNMDLNHKHEIAERFIENQCQNLIKLGELFEEVEKEHIEGIQDRSELLFYFFIIYKGLIALNEQKMLEIMVSQKFYLQTFGALEWDPEATPDNENMVSTMGKTFNEVEEEKQHENVLLNQLSESNSHVATYLFGNKQNSYTNSGKGNGNNSKKQLWQDSIIATSAAKDEQEVNTMIQSLEPDQFQVININQQAASQDAIQPENTIATQLDEKIKQQSEMNNPPLNYRDFLQNVVKFKQVVDIRSNEIAVRNQTSQEIQVESPTQGTRNGTDLQNITIEERIHINYRLQYLKDTVLARNIEDASVNIINQIIMQNNRDIVDYFLEEEELPYIAGSSSLKGNSLKDRIIEKIRDNTNIKEKHLAIEFMIELCQILKSLQFSQGIGTNNASNFIYGHTPNKNGNMYDKLNQVNLIGILSQSFEIFVPDENILKAHLIRDTDLNHQQICRLYKDLDIYDSVAIQDLIETKQDRNQQDKQIRCYFDETTRLDSMKMNSMEIIISFQQSPHIPPNYIIGFVSGQEQSKLGFPFLNNLVQHMIYSNEQGLKIQIADFFKQLFESDQFFDRQHNKEILYKEVILKFVTFIDEFGKNTEVTQSFPDEDENSEQSLTYRKIKCLEYSVYLILQVLSKVVAGHKFPFRNFMNNNSVIMKVASMVNLKSNIINIEIVKFYKSILKSKDTTYIQYIIFKNLFYPINQIFEETFHETNPPLIHSCVRDLYELIFSQSKNNDFQSSRKLIEYLLNTDKKSQAIIKNPKYKQIFSKYESGARDPNDHFLNNKNYNSDNSFDGSPVSNPIMQKDNDNHFFNKKSKRSTYSIDINKGGSFWDQHINDDFSFADINNNEDQEFIDDRLQGAQHKEDLDAKLADSSYFGQDDAVKGSSLHQVDDEQTGNLSPIGTNQFNHDLEEEAPFSSDGKPNPPSFKKSMSDGEKENEVNQFNHNNNMFDINLEIDKNNSKLKMSLSQQINKTADNDDIDDIEISNFNDNAYKQIQDGAHQTIDLAQRQQAFRSSLLKKRDSSGSNSVGKIFQKVQHTNDQAQELKDAAAVGGTKSPSPLSEKDKSLYQKAHSYCDGLLDKLSTNSLGLMPDDELAKDMGIFTLDKDSKSLSIIGSVQPKIINRVNYRRRGSFDELDIPPLQVKSHISKYNPNKFLNKFNSNKEYYCKSDTFEGIFTKQAPKSENQEESLRVGNKRSIDVHTGQIQGSAHSADEHAIQVPSPTTKHAKLSKTNQPDI